MVQLEEEVVVAEAPLLADPPADRLARLVEDLAAGAEEPGVTGRAQLRGRLFEPIEGVEQRVGGKLRALLAGFGERLRSVAPEQAARREERVRVGEPRLDRVKLGPGARLPVLPTIEPGSVPHLLLKRLPVLRPLAPDFLEEAAPRRLPRLHGNVERRSPVDPKAGLRPPLPDPGGEIVGPEPALRRTGRERPRGGVHAPAPEVARRARDELAVVPAHLELEGEAAVEGEVGEHPLAEPVDREDVRPVDVPEGRIEPPRRRLRVEPGPFPPGGEELRGLGAFVRLAGRQRPAGGPEGSPDPLAKLGGRGAGERHHEDLVEPPAFHHHEPGDDAGQLPGLAGPGARLDEGHAGGGLAGRGPAGPAGPRPARNGRARARARGGHPAQRVAFAARPSRCAGHSVHFTAYARGARRSVASVSNLSVRGSRSS